MDLRKIKKLIELVEESGISELEVKSGDEAVRIARPTQAHATPIAVVESGSVLQSAAPAETHAASALTVAEPEPAEPPERTQARPQRPSRTIHAPMAGTFYAAGEPGAAPFVALGAQVEQGQVLCIIESMKMMNEVLAEYSGECVEILVSNAEAVSAGQPLLRLA